MQLLGRSTFVLCLAAAGGLMLGLAFVMVGVAAAGVSGQATAPPYGSDLPNKAYAAGLANDEFRAGASPTPTPTTTASATPTATTTPAANTITLPATSGFVFNPPGLAADGYDVWWGSSGFYAGAGGGILSLGVHASLLDSGRPPATGYHSTPLAPKPGEAFAVRIAAGGANQYPSWGRLWVHKDSPAADGSVTFDWDFMAGKACGGTTAKITALNRSGVPESVTVTGAGDMTGWTILSEDYNDRFTFPANFVLGYPEWPAGPGTPGSVAIVSDAAQFPDAQDRLWWDRQARWRNDHSNSAVLYDCEGTLVQRFLEP